MGQVWTIHACMNLVQMNPIYAYMAGWLTLNGPQTALFIWVYIQMGVGDPMSFLDIDEIEDTRKIHLTFLK